MTPKHERTHAHSHLVESKSKRPSRPSAVVRGVWCVGLCSLVILSRNDGTARGGGEEGGGGRRKIDCERTGGGRCLAFRGGPDAFLGCIVSPPRAAAEWTPRPPPTTWPFAALIRGACEPRAWRRQSHTASATPRVARRWFVGVRRHRAHHLQVRSNRSRTLFPPRLSSGHVCGPVLSCHPVARRRRPHELQRWDCAGRSYARWIQNTQEVGSLPRVPRWPPTRRVRHLTPARYRPPPPPSPRRNMAPHGSPAIGSSAAATARAAAAGRAVLPAVLRIPRQRACRRRCRRVPARPSKKRRREPLVRVRSAALGRLGGVRERPEETRMSTHRRCQQRSWRIADTHTYTRACPSRALECALVRSEVWRGKRGTNAGRSSREYTWLARCREHQAGSLFVLLHPGVCNGFSLR